MKQLLKEAIRQHQQGQLDEAESIYQQVLNQLPNDVDALHYMGVLLHQQGDSQQGSRLIRKAIKRNPGYVDAHKNLGKILKETGKLEKAVQCYKTAIKLRPDDAEAYNNLCVILRLLNRHEQAIEAGVTSVNYYAENPTAWVNFGKALKAGGMIESAIAAFYRALDLDKELVDAHNELCATLYRAEKASDTPEATIQERIKAHQEWLKNEPDSPVARYMLAACLGDESVSRAPDEVVKQLFDGFAISFDQSLAKLDYKVPDLIKDHLNAVYGTRQADLSVLDAGCGTGLCSVFLRPLSTTLLGVDLSSGMLKQAKRRRLYDDLIEAELTIYLQETDHSFDLIVCADTLCYFGHLETIVQAAATSLTPGGRFIFSVEHLIAPTTDGYRINTSGRYSHAKEHVQTCVSRAGLTLTSMSEKILRKESGEPVHGLIVDVEK